MLLSDQDRWVACVKSAPENVIDLARKWAEDMEIALNTGTAFEALPRNPPDEADPQVIEAARQIIFECWEHGVAYGALLSTPMTMGGGGPGEPDQ